MDSLGYLEGSSAQKRISILSVPLDIGSDNTDVAAGPKYLLGLGLQSALTSTGFTVTLLPEIAASKKSFWRPAKKKEDTLLDISTIALEVSKVVKEEVLKDSKLVTLGGDHAISVGTIAGAAEALNGDLGVIWIDAHGDINTHETSASGNIHGMTSAILLGFGDKRLTDLVKTKIKKENIVYIGLKDLDQAEIDLLRRENITVVTIMDILQNGFEAITKQIEILEQRVKNMWVSLDVDVIDEQFAPAAAMATPGGLSYREITNLLMYIGKRTQVVGMDVVEIAPKKDTDTKTGQLCIELIVSAFGAKHNWYSQYMDHYKKLGS